MGSDEADIVYHENTHGLSNRLVVDANGNSTLGNGQSGAMGEAWSDWYAMDYLVDHHLQRDRAAKADRNASAGAMTPSARSRSTPGRLGPGPRRGRVTPGATYGDSAIIGQAECMPTGDLRCRFGIPGCARLADQRDLVTCAMELSPTTRRCLDGGTRSSADEVDSRRHPHSVPGALANRGWATSPAR
jgi:hypothetical protein